MNATSIVFGLVIVIFTILLLAMRKLIPQSARVRSQRMCPACGLITSLKSRCLECGVATVSTR
jgi:hypothetical protein